MPGKMISPEDVLAIQAELIASIRGTHVVRGTTGPETALAGPSTTFAGIDLYLIPFRIKA